MNESDQPVSGRTDPSAHVVQLYESDASLTRALARFAGAGLAAGDAVVIIATPEHRSALEEQLRSQGFALDSAREQGRYVALDAEQTLARFMVGGRVTTALFRDVIGSIVSRAAQRAPRVHAFGEMVALLWAGGQKEAALQLEQMWSEIARELPLFVLCAYLRGALGRESDTDETSRIFDEHARVLTTEAYGALEDPDARLRVVAELEQRSGEEARARLSAIVESSDDAIIGKTLDGIVTSWNAGAERIFGYSAEEMIGQPIARIVPPDRSSDVTNILASIGRGERVEHFESDRVRKDGRRINVSLTVSPIRDSAGKIIGASKIARDVTDRKRAEREQQKALRELTTLYAVGQAVAAELNRERVLQTITDAATDLSGAKFGAFFYNLRDAEGGHYLLYTLSGAPREAFEKFGAPRNTAMFAPTFAGAGVVRVDDVRHDPRYGWNAPHHGAPDGHLPVASYLAVPVTGRSGEVFGGLFLGHPEPAVFSEEAERVVVALAAQAAIALDNAKLYEAEQRARMMAEQADRAKDQFLAMLGHELRNPLSSVRNAIATAVLDPGKVRRALEIASRATDQLTRLVDDLLDVTRITQGRITLRRARVSFADVIQRAIDSVRQQFEERSVALTLSLPPRSLDLDADAARLEQIVSNLLANAAKFTEPGGRVTVALDRVAGDAVLRVRDTGVGIDAELLPRVFDLFVQGDQALDRTRGGLGIGLTLVKQLVEMHGGQVQALSEGPGRGAEFIVRLPATVAVAAPSPAPSFPRPSRGAGARVLIVEDNADAAESLMMLLELLGLSVRAVGDGFAALEAARVERPDIMLVDIGLPGMNGYELAERIRQDETLSGITLVALTGYGQEEDRSRSRAAGFDHHLVKPVDVDKVETLVAGLDPSRSTVH